MAERSLCHLFCLTAVLPFCLDGQICDRAFRYRTQGGDGAFHFCIGRLFCCESLCDRRGKEQNAGGSVAVCFRVAHGFIGQPDGQKQCGNEDGFLKPCFPGIRGKQQNRKGHKKNGNGNRCSAPGMDAGLCAGIGNGEFFAAFVGMNGLMLGSVIP